MSLSSGADMQTVALWTSAPAAVQLHVERSSHNYVASPLHPTSAVICKVIRKCFSHKYKTKPFIR